MSNDFYHLDTISRCADLPLFAPRPPSARGSVTSAAAADSLDGDTLNAMQRRVLALLQATPGGLTDEEMQRRLGHEPEYAAAQADRACEAQVCRGGRDEEDGEWTVGDGVEGDPGVALTTGGG
jgi:hypothetical protein